MSLPGLQSLYNSELKNTLKEQLQVKIPPQLNKIVLNVGIGKAVSNKKYLEIAMTNISAVSGQKGILTSVRQSNAGFGIRTGWPIGCKVTLRREKMYDFLDRFLNIVVPRIPDFGGLNPKSFDGRGNYTMGLADFAVFPECDLEQERMGLDISFVTTASNDEMGYKLLLMLGFPFKK